MRIVSLQHVPFEGPAMIAQWAQERGHTLEELQVYAGAPLPSPAGTDGLLIMGGPMGVYETESHPWLRDEISCIGSLLEKRIPMLGICLGAQLMASALGAEVKPMGYREIGWRPVDGGDSPLTVFHWHGDTFDVPAGAERVFSNDACANQGFTWGKATALQFHLEMDTEAVQRLLSAGRAEIGDSLGRGERYVQTVETILSEAPERERSLRPVLYALLDAIFV